MARRSGGTRFRASFSGIGKMIRSPQMQAAMRSRAEKVAALAAATAPIDSGEYKSSFKVTSGARGGVRRDRAYGRVTNTAPHAVYVEFGTSKVPAHHTLRRALRAAGD
ncbi:HK97 gp10 family phage protein [Spirillospora sp. NBC_01491]|uniref:HK97 gp10 family phage protein n=1 Tax=Spirillospora sp. NBC_01491 TaxID=2976007 RepID=UPI002E2FDD9C|nr:HK97 gp10 family phage protein [Spirillospora sp. NBC_01491]